MEISFESKEIIVYREFSRQLRRIQESAECVVPDTEPDIEKIAAVQSGVLLKSKDLSARGVVISGELCASVLYIRDGQTGISGVRIRRPFTVEYETEVPESETLMQISLLIQGTDVRVVNPRKISVAFDLEGELCCYRSESLCVDSALPENTAGLYVKTEMQTLTLPNAVCEKSLVLNEQFAFPEGQCVPAELLAEKPRLQINDCQLLGSKMIVKGSAELMVCGPDAENGLPTVRTFSAPFSQIVDVGVESIQHCTVKPEITGAYFDLIDTINGEKALDMELHAVLQIVCFEQREIRRVVDAYSNLMPAELMSGTQEYVLSSAEQRESLQTRERLELMEECAELLCVFPTLTRIAAEKDKLNAAVMLDFLFRGGDGKLSACRRTVALSADIAGGQIRVLRAGPVEWEATAEGENIDCTIRAELDCAVCENVTVTAVSGVILDEEKAYIAGALPTITLVRREGESLWTLAKRYHSSEKKIRELNEDAENSRRMLLIPKCQ